MQLLHELLCVSVTLREREREAHQVETMIALLRRVYETNQAVLPSHLPFFCLASPHMFQLQKFHKRTSSTETSLPYTTMERRSTREHHHREPWSYSCGFMSGFSWPPRSYTCSFCKREFRSAQALGGHMNVHRRDRARLRQCSPPPLNPNPNPNPTTPIPNLNFSPPHCANNDDDSNTPITYTFSSLLEPLPFAFSSPAKALEVNLDLGIGVCTGGLEDGLDLELRLGYS